MDDSKPPCRITAPTEPSQNLFHPPLRCPCVVGEMPCGVFPTGETAIKTFPNPLTNSVNSAVDNLCKSPLRLAFKRATAGRSVFVQ